MSAEGVTVAEGGPLAPRTAWGTGLPGSWRAAIEFCPFCSGTGLVNASTTNGDTHTSVACGRCDGTGDLLGAMLAYAYRLGRDEALRKLGEVRAVTALAIDQLEHRPIEAAVLKREMGL